MAPTPAQRVSLIEATLAWYASAQRPLPWRAPGTSAWGVLVSEFMAQQTQVERVVPIWETWMRRWPTAADLAASPPGEAIAAWGRLGYPRRAKWLHRSAQLIAEQHGNSVPSDVEALRALPGVGEYTAAAVQAFAFNLPSVVLDTNVRRTLARITDGRAMPGPSITVAERHQADGFVGSAAEQAAQWSQAVMELGALVCTARDPRCEQCPVQRRCAWRRAGKPLAALPQRQQARYAGSDRQARGRILAVLRDSTSAVAEQRATTDIPDPDQAERALGSLIADGLVERTRNGRLRLPR